VKTTILLSALAMLAATLPSPGRPATPASPARADEPAGARDFVARLYAHYPHKAHAPPFEPIGRSAAAVFDPAMVALLREMDRVTPKGDAPALDGDPLCDCQDDQGMTVRIGPVSRAGPASASAVVRIAFAGAPASDARQLKLDLVSLRGQWRVHDVLSKDMPSLRAYLIKANAEAKAQK
jgi:hypothetical protein